MGIKAEIQDKLKPMAAEDTVEVVARGEANMVVVVATRISDVPGVDVVGPIPEELQTKISFAAGLGSAAKGQALIRFLPRPLLQQRSEPRASIRSDALVQKAHLICT
jgi:molybdate transport system substrate-binding protein